MELRIRLQLRGSSTNKIQVIEDAKRTMKPIMEKWYLNNKFYITERIENDDYYLLTIKVEQRQCKCKKGTRVGNCIALKHIFDDIRQEYRIILYKKFFFMESKTQYEI